MTELVHDEYCLVHESQYNMSKYFTRAHGIFKKYSMKVKYRPILYDERDGDVFTLSTLV